MLTVICTVFKDAAVKIIKFCTLLCAMHFVMALCYRQ